MSKPENTPAAARVHYFAMPAPGTLQPSIWMDCGGPDVGRVKNCRTMLGARFGAALRNLAMWRAA